MEPKHTDKFIPTPRLDCEILDIEPCYIEDRRASQTGNALIVRHTCETCGRVYLAILPARDTCRLDSWCNACHKLGSFR